MYRSDKITKLKHTDTTKSSVRSFVFYLILICFLFFHVFVVINVDAYNFPGIFALWRHEIKIGFIHGSCGCCIFHWMVIWSWIVATTILGVIAFGVWLMWVALTVRWCARCGTRQWVRSICKYEIDEKIRRWQHWREMQWLKMTNGN